MALKFEDAFAQLKTLVGFPCQLEVADEALWGLKGGVQQAIVFHWPSVPQSQREPFLKTLFGERALGPYLTRIDDELQLANHDLVPFALVGTPGLMEEGSTFEARIDSQMTGVLFLDLVHGANAGACPVLLWDLKRFGKVASKLDELKLRLGGGGTVSHVVLSMPQRTFTMRREGKIHYFQIEVRGRHVKMQRGVLRGVGAKDWASNEVKEGDFPSSADAKAQADLLVQRHLDSGYAETQNLE